MFWLQELRDEENSFFLFVSYHDPHEPIAADPRWQKLYESDDPSFRAHHGNISQMDAAFGRMVKLLDDLDLAENTHVIFTGDNGPTKTSFYPNSSAGPLREKKATSAMAAFGFPALFAGLITRNRKPFPTNLSSVPTFCRPSAK